jgi:hypothetical protein
MVNIRMFPPISGKAASITLQGRTYSAPANGYVDVPDFDSWTMQANGWIECAAGGVGATSTRPLKPPVKTMWHDTTLAKNIIFDGTLWRDPNTGAAV